jgi:hypothetical protein
VVAQINGGSLHHQDQADSASNVQGMNSNHGLLAHLDNPLATTKLQRQPNNNLGRSLLDPNVGSFGIQAISGVKEGESATVMGCGNTPNHHLLPRTLRRLDRLDWSLREMRSRWSTLKRTPNWPTQQDPQLPPFRQTRLVPLLRKGMKSLPTWTNSLLVMPMRSLLHQPRPTCLNRFNDENHLRSHHQG